MFTDRKEAGELLARKVKQLGLKKAVVYGITRGGVILAYEISHLLDFPLVPIIVKKIGAPHNPELALGAVTYNKVSIFDKELVNKLGVSSDFLKQNLQQKQKEIQSLKKQLMHVKRVTVTKKIVIIVDDGIATGSTVKAVIRCLDTKKAKKIIVAVPVISKDTYRKLLKEVDMVIALEVADNFSAVGQFYKDFPQVSNEDVVQYTQSL